MSQPQTNRYSHQRRDCPGLNAVIRGAVKAGTQLGYDMVGFLKGYEGSSIR